MMKAILRHCGIVLISSVIGISATIATSTASAQGQQFDPVDEYEMGTFLADRVHPDTGAALADNEYVFEWDARLLSDALAKPFGEDFILIVQTPFGDFVNFAAEWQREQRERVVAWGWYDDFSSNSTVRLGLYLNRVTGASLEFSGGFDVSTDRDGDGFRETVTYYDFFPTANANVSIMRLGSPDSFKLPVAEPNDFVSTPSEAPSALSETIARNAKSLGSRFVATAAAPATVTMGVVYTSEFAAAFGSGTDAAIQHFIDETTKIFRDSGTFVELDLGASLLFNPAGAFVDPQNPTHPEMGAAITLLQNDASIQAWRDQHYIDHVAMFTVGAKGGVAPLCAFPKNTPLNVSQAEGCAYSVNSLDTNLANPEFPRVIAHEVGHSMGLNHSPSVGGYDANGDRFPYTKGFDNGNPAPNGNAVGSVMSYVFGAGSSRLFSSPALSFQSTTLGDAGSADAVRWLNEAGPMVEQVRVRPAVSPPTPPPGQPAQSGPAGIRIDLLEAKKYAQFAAYDLESINLTFTADATQFPTASELSVECGNTSATAPSFQGNFTGGSETLPNGLGYLRQNTTHRCVAKAVGSGGTLESTAVYVYTGLEDGLPLRDSDVGRIALIYAAILGRAPERNGMDFWFNNLDTGVQTIENMRESFTVQPEWTNGIGAMSRGGVVSALYRNLFGRDPEPAGFDYWVNGGGSGVTPAQLVTTLVNAAIGTDPAAMENRSQAALYYMNYYGGLDDLTESMAAIAGVTNDPATLAAAIQRIDGYR